MTQPTCFARCCAAVILCLILSAGSLLPSYAVSAGSVEWQDVDDRSRISVKEYGAVGDGETDDTEAIEKAMKKASVNRKTVYFPAGTYRVTKTISIGYSYGMYLGLQGQDAESVTLVGAETLDGPMFQTYMRSGFHVTNLSFEQNGTGPVLDTLFLTASGCRFRGSAANRSNLVQFYGSNCKIMNCSFLVSNPDAYAIQATKRKESSGIPEGAFIAINSYIVDCSFSGQGKGILVNSEQEKSRLEGLKICDNVFTNTGSAQITLQTFLHCDISGNTMSGCTGNAIDLQSSMLLIHGLYLCGNTISCENACVAASDTSGPGTMLQICDNVLSGGKYGLLLPSSIGSMIVDNNIINDAEKAGLEIQSCQSGIITNNTVTTTGSGIPIVENDCIRNNCVLAGNTTKAADSKLTKAIVVGSTCFLALLAAVSIIVVKHRQKKRSAVPNPSQEKPH